MGDLASATGIRDLDFGAPTERPIALTVQIPGSYYLRPVPDVVDV